MIVPAHRYNVFHALAAITILIAAVSRNFWHNFIYGGFVEPPPVNTLLVAIGSQLALMGTLLLVIWGSTLFGRTKAEDDARENTPARLAAAQYAAKLFIPICLMAFGLEFASAQIMEKVFELPVHGQDLVVWLKPGTYPLSIRLLLVVIAAVEAPLMEEALFRGVIFRGLGTIMPLWAALVLSGLVFGIIHVNAATLVPLWFLGAAFAWLYWRTKSIFAPITAHLLFNLINLVLVFSGVAS